MDQTSLINKHQRILGYASVFVIVALLNIYQNLLSGLDHDHETTWALVCFSSILYLCPIKRWPGAIAAIVSFHLAWQVLPLTESTHWPIIAYQFIGSIGMAVTGKYFGKIWNPEDFTGYFTSYVPSLVPIAIVYSALLLTHHWLVLGDPVFSQVVQPSFIFQHLHILELAVVGNVMFLVLQWYNDGLPRPNRLQLTIIAIVAHVGLLYFLPHNFLLLSLVIGVSIYYTGLQGVALPSVAATLVSPFIYHDGSNLISPLEELDYALLVLFMGLIGLVRDGFITAAKNGEPYKLVLSKSGTVSLTMASPEVDALRLQLQEKNQQISLAYENLETKNVHLQNLTHTLEKQKQSYKNMVEVDALTGLKSRRYFSNFLADGTRTIPYSLLMVDLDNFKSVNDSYGHRAGDELLQACAKVMQTSSLNIGFAARLGGEEFCLALRDTNIYEAKIIAERLRYSISQTQIYVLGVDIRRSASIGISELPLHAELKDSISLADAALYQAKAKGKNTTAVADALFISKWKEQQRSPKLDAILTGLDNREFEFYIQPICDNRTHKAVGFETLMRWHRSDGTVLLPSSFLDIALSPPVYSKFKDASLSQLVPILMSLMSRNPLFYLAFNTDSTFIHSKDLIVDLISRFDLSDANPNCLVLELPETAVIDDKELVFNNVSLLRDNGFGIALDDFGMEHSNMDRIRDIPADFVKIDRSFIVQMEGNPRSLAIIKALVNMAKDLNFEIIAEGIETQGQAKLLAQAGITKVQGYYYGRPKPVDYWLDQLDRDLI